jgi:hypothetical protein
MREQGPVAVSGGQFFGDERRGHAGLDSGGTYRRTAI